jgi:hypothetical protein
MRASLQAREPTGPVATILGAMQLPETMGASHHGEMSPVGAASSDRAGEA